PGEVRILGPKQSFRDALGVESSGLRLDRALRGIVSGRWDGAEGELRTMQEGGGAAGGFLLGPELAGYLIDLARAKSVCLRAGAGTIPMQSAELEIPVLTSDVAAQWIGETGAITPTDAAIGSHVLHAKTLACLTSVSVELAEDTNIGQIVQNSMAQAISLKLDYAALRGIGVVEPTGLRYAPNVNERAAVGTPTYDEFSEAIETIWTQNGEPNAAIYSPRTAGFLDRVKNGDGEPAMAPASWKNLQYHLVSSQIPETLGLGGNESEAYVGDFRQLQFGVRSAVRIEVFRSGTVGALDAVGQKLIWIRAYVRADVHIARETHFTRLLGVTW
ncbi:MAG: phage major capsid protein, partial [Pirellulales bacterium]